MFGKRIEFQNSDPSQAYSTLPHTITRGKIEGKHKFRTLCVGKLASFPIKSLQMRFRRKRIWKKEKPKRKLEIEVSFPQKWEYLKGGGENHRGAKHLVSLSLLCVFFLSFLFIVLGLYPRGMNGEKKAKFITLRKKVAANKKYSPTPLCTCCVSLFCCLLEPSSFVLMVSRFFVYILWKAN